jgi:hypothetical protein
MTESCYKQKHRNHTQKRAQFLIANKSISEDTFEGQHYPYCNVSDPCETLQRDSSTMWGLVKCDLRGSLLETTMIDLMWDK